MTLIYANDTPEGPDYYPGYHGVPGDIVNARDTYNYDIYYILTTEDDRTWAMTPGTGEFILFPRSPSYSSVQDDAVVYSQIKSVYYTLTIASGSGVIRTRTHPYYIGDEYQDIYDVDPLLHPWANPQEHTVAGGTTLRLDVPIPDYTMNGMDRLYTLIECVSGSVEFSLIKFTIMRSDGVWKKHPTEFRYGPWHNGHLDYVPFHYGNNPIPPEEDYRTAVVAAPAGPVHDLGWPGYYPAFTWPEVNTDAVAMKQSIYGAPYSGIQEAGFDAPEIAVANMGSYVLSGSWAANGTAISIASRADHPGVFPIPPSPQWWAVSSKHNAGREAVGDPTDYSSINRMHTIGIPEGPLTRDWFPFSAPLRNVMPGASGIHYTGAFDWETNEWTWEGFQARPTWNAGTDDYTGWIPGDRVGPRGPWQASCTFATGAQINPLPDGATPTSCTLIFDYHFGWQRGDPFPAPGTGDFTATLTVTAGETDIPGVPEVVMHRRIAFRTDVDQMSVSHSNFTAAGNFPAAIIRTPRWRRMEPALEQIVAPSTDGETGFSPLRVLDRQMDWNKVGNESWDENTGRLKSHRPDVWRGERKPGDSEVGFYRERMWDGTEWVEPVKMMEK